MGANSSSQIDMANNLSQRIQEEITQKKVVIYSKTSCPYCIMAKRVFEEINEEFHCVELDQIPEGNKIQDIMAKMTGARTVPRVFIKGKCVGGGTDVQRLHREGKLIKLLD